MSRFSTLQEPITVSPQPFQALKYRTHSPTFDRKAWFIKGKHLNCLVASHGTIESVNNQARALHLLSHSPVFAGVPASELSPLASSGEFTYFRRSEHLFRAGEAIEQLHLVSSGSVRVYRLARNGTRELTLQVEGPRQLVTGIVAFQHHPTYPASAQALATPTELLSLPITAVLDRVLHTPPLAQAVFNYFARRQTELLSRVDQLVFSELSSRLALYLLEHAQPTHDLPTNSELAALLGTVPELVSRKLGEFYRLGLIHLERRCVEVIDATELSRLATD